MKTLKDYLNAPYRMEIIPDTAEGGFTVSCPELPGCITTGATIDEALENLQQAKKDWFEAALADGVKINDPIDQDSYSGQFKLRLPKSLHKQLADQARIEGISMNQYCVYLLAKNS